MNKAAKWNVWIMMGVSFLLVSMVSCATDQVTQTGSGGPSRVDIPIQAVENVPDWVFKKGAAFSGERQVFYGVGNVAAIRNSALRRRSAEAAARRDLQQTFQVYIAGLNKQYMAETTAGDMDKVSVEQHIEDVMKQVTSGTLVGSSIVEYWEHPSKNESYALARLDLERFQDVMQNYKGTKDQYKELDAKVREFVRKNARKAHDGLNQELAKSGKGMKGGDGISDSCDEVGGESTKPGIKSYTCCCDSPCSGCRTCEFGCWAICESYCIKGCSSSDLHEVPEGVFEGDAQVKGVNLNMPKERVLPLLERLFGKARVSEKLAGANMSEADFDSATRIKVQLRDTNLDGIIKEISDAP